LIKKGSVNAQHKHKVGDKFDFDTDRGKLCPMAMHVAFPYVDILSYVGKLPSAAFMEKLFLLSRCRRYEHI